MGGENRKLAECGDEDAFLGLV
ncbi:uncharacterized protein G2W53_011672 [Senna tora]|uniref:Uncharacterized protein n=1 Tax=Senna tora TaxID=362788 RepID=A0A834X1P9_9FABA|nr:uncharacterized protein G2W53_011672 [Senna tora]